MQSIPIRAIMIMTVMDKDRLPTRMLQIVTGEVRDQLKQVMDQE